ncbi:hypothetical protein CYMTET_40509 [Cymbomonas tetramitiformis]|uniref:Uncharacterized protein n=1 Tax=Cymbomonas tetramitiformis TaxID=36881 RepID=A0AAE0C7Z7_9CHLO|nr:hypothetical protein CYMTET_40509 [Cymbomonas tetramitiformis]
MTAKGTPTDAVQPVELLSRAGQRKHYYARSGSPQRPKTPQDFAMAPDFLYQKSLRLHSNPLSRPSEGPPYKTVSRRTPRASSPRERFTEQQTRALEKDSAEQAQKKSLNMDFDHVAQLAQGLENILSNETSQAKGPMDEWRGLESSTSIASRIEKDLGIGTSAFQASGRSQSFRSPSTTREITRGIGRDFSSGREKVSGAPPINFYNPQHEYTRKHSAGVVFSRAAKASWISDSIRKTVTNLGIDVQRSDVPAIPVAWSSGDLDARAQPTAVVGETKLSPARHKMAAAARNPRAIGRPANGNKTKSNTQSDSASRASPSSSAKLSRGPTEVEDESSKTDRTSRSSRTTRTSRTTRSSRTSLHRQPGSSASEATAAPKAVKQPEKGYPGAVKGTAKARITTGREHSLFVGPARGPRVPRPVSNSGPPTSCRKPKKTTQVPAAESYMKEPWYQSAHHPEARPVMAKLESSPPSPPMESQSAPNLGAYFAPRPEAHQFWRRPCTSGASATSCIQQTISGADVNTPWLPWSLWTPSATREVKSQPMIALDNNKHAMMKLGSRERMSVGPARSGVERAADLGDINPERAAIDRYTFEVEDSELPAEVDATYCN